MKFLLQKKGPTTKLRNGQICFTRPKTYSEKNSDKIPSGGFCDQEKVLSVSEGCMILLVPRSSLETKTSLLSSQISSSCAPPPHFAVFLPAFPANITPFHIHNQITFGKCTNDFLGGRSCKSQALTYAIL